MTKNTLDELLARSAPPTGDEGPAVRSAMDAVVARSREAGRTSRSRRRLWWLAVPALLGPGVVLATSAGTDVRAVPDFSIPISYTTQSGRQLSCSIDFFNGEIGYVEVSTAATDYLRAQDWTGVGQRIHDAAVRYETDPAWLGSELNSDSPDPADLSWRAWITAADDNILDTLPPGTLVSGDGGLGGSTDCTGDLR